MWLMLLLLPPLLPPLLQIPPPGVVFDRWECFYVTMVNVTTNVTTNITTNGTSNGTTNGTTNGTVVTVTNSTMGTLPVPLTGGTGFTLGPNDVITCVAVYRFDLPRLALLSDYVPANYSGSTAVLGALGLPPTNDSCPAVPSQRLNVTGNVTVGNPGTGFCGSANRTNGTGPTPPAGTLQVCSSLTFIGVMLLSLSSMSTSCVCGRLCLPIFTAWLNSAVASSGSCGKRYPCPIEHGTCSMSWHHQLLLLPPLLLLLLLHRLVHMH
jgi:hypothetical protein